LDTFKAETKVSDQKGNSLGVILMILASTCFATMSALIKAVGPDIPPLELVFLRCIFSLPFLVLIIRHKKKPYFVTARKVLLFRTVFGMGAMIGFFYALSHMPLAECVFIGRSQPLILVLLAPFILGESTPRAAWFAIIAGFAGVALIMKPAMEWPLASWITLGAAASSAMAHLLIRRLNRTDHPLVIVFNFTLLAAILTSVWVLFNYVPPSPRQWLYIAGIVVFATVGQTLMTTAYRRERAPIVAAASYVAVILSVFYGYVFWGEIPHTLAWFGGGLIVFGGLMLLRARLYIREPATPAAT
jgi:drug/metabolite transporter (DMT)-like permease